MIEDRYELVEATQTTPRRTPRKRVQQALWILLGAAVVVLAALYVPVLWEETQSLQSVTAEAAYIAAPQSVDESSLLSDQEALADLYESVAPSVVNIQVTTQAESAMFPGFNMPEGEGPLLESQGSGFIYDEQGHIVTNNHVVEDAVSVLVIFNDGRWADAEVVAADPQADLAVIKVTPPEGMEWRPLQVEVNDNLRVGHTVVAIGNPYGLAGTMTTGIVSALGRGLPVGDDMETRYTLPDVIQTDAAINPGNSGGPLLNLNGQVVGVNFAIRSEVRSNSGVGFAVPAAVVRRVVPALIEDGAYNYAYLGLSGSTISAELSKTLELPEGLLGVYVAEVIPGGPSDDAGLRGGDRTVEGPTGIQFRSGGDIVTAIDGQPVQRFEDLVSYLVTKASPGQEVTLTVVRDGETLEIDVTLGERPVQDATAQTREPGPGISAREAIDIAVEAVEETGMLRGAIVEKVAAPDERDGADVWVVELSTSRQTATVVVDAETGDVLAMDVQ